MPLYWPSSEACRASKYGQLPNSPYARKPDQRHRSIEGKLESRGLEPLQPRQVHEGRGGFRDRAEMGLAEIRPRQPPAY
jgi:hypothetical protein